jgi:gamma-glutamyltranspeptidase
MGVVEPMMNGLGGDLFALVYDASTGKLQGLNASGWAPSGLTVDFLRHRDRLRLGRHRLRRRPRLSPTASP